MHKTIFAAVIVLLAVPAPFALAQGPLSPPGSPGETMKALDQVEPRILIPGGASNYTLSASGSYYLGSNMYGTLTVSASNVTVDLMGFTIRAVSGDAINISGNMRNVTIRNGIINGSANGHGVDGRYLRGSNSRFEDLQVSGCGYAGLYIGSDCLVRNCLLISNVQYGVRSSSVGGLEVRNCRILGNEQVGLSAAGGSRIVDNVIERNGNVGLQLTGADSYVANNYVRDHATNYSIAAGNRLNLLLCEVPQKVDWPCAITFAGTLTCAEDHEEGIEITSDNVSIDLGGHALIGPGDSSGYGILQYAQYGNLSVCNGRVLNWSAASRAGVHAAGKNNRISNLQAVSNYTGISVGNNALITDCMVGHNRRNGIWIGTGCSLSGSTAAHNDENGIDGNDGNCISRCSAYANGENGISVDTANLIESCTTYSNLVDGISAGYDCNITGCASSFNSSNGVRVLYNCRISDSVFHNNGKRGNGAGIYTRLDGHTIDNNSCYNNTIGLRIEGAGSLVIRNRSRINGTNWVVDANNHLGPIVQPPYSAAVHGDTGGSGVGSTDPWANFSR